MIQQGAFFILATKTTERSPKQEMGLLILVSEQLKQIDRSSYPLLIDPIYSVKQGSLGQLRFCCFWMFSFVLFFCFYFGFFLFLSRWFSMALFVTVYFSHPPPPVSPSLPSSPSLLPTVCLSPLLCPLPLCPLVSLLWPLFVPWSLAFMVWAPSKFKDTFRAPALACLMWQAQEVIRGFKNGSSETFRQTLTSRRDMCANKMGGKAKRKK